MRSDLFNLFHCRKSKKSLNILQDNNETNLAQLIQYEILNHLALAMLTSIEERPTAQTLLNLVNGLKKHFCAPMNNEYQHFITHLLNHSPLNKNTNIEKHLTLEPESSNKKNRMFSIQ